MLISNVSLKTEVVNLIKENYGCFSFNDISRHKHPIFNPIFSILSFSMNNKQNDTNVEYSFLKIDYFFKKYLQLNFFNFNLKSLYLL